MGDQWLDGWEMMVDGTACERVVDECRLVHIPDNLLDIYGNNPDVRAIGAASYMGMPLLDLDGKVLGHLAVLDLRPMPAEPRAQALFQIFAARAGAELRRLRAEAQVREREQKLGRLVGSAMVYATRFRGSPRINASMFVLTSTNSRSRASPALHAVCGVTSKLSNSAAASMSG
jgi:hypothetical protein